MANALNQTQYAAYRAYGTASIDYILPRFSSPLAHHTKTKIEFYRYQSLHTTTRNEGVIPAGPNYQFRIAGV